MIAMSEDKKYGFAGEMYCGSFVAVCSLHKKNALIIVTIDRIQNLPKNIEKVSNEMECT